MASFKNIYAATKLAGCVCGEAGSILQSVMATVSIMKANSVVRARYQNQVEAIVPLLESIEMKLNDYPSLLNDQAILASLRYLEQTIQNGVKLCQELEPSNKVLAAKLLQRGENLALADSQAKILENLNWEFSQAMIAANLAMQLLSCRIQEEHSQERRQEIEQLRQLLHPSAGVFIIGKEPVQVTNVTTESSRGYLGVSWNDNVNKNLQIQKYQIRLNRTNLTVEKECKTWSSSVSIRIADRVKPWNEYSVQVRAVNEAGFGPWSEPAICGLMDQSPPVKPITRIKSAPTNTSLYLEIDRPKLYNLQQVTYCVLKKRIINPTSPLLDWNIEEVACIFDDNSTVHTVHVRNLQTRLRYQFQISLCNQWGESEPTMVEMADAISGMLPGSPQRIFFVKQSRSHKEVRITWKPPKINAGSIDHYVIEKCKKKYFSIWEKAANVTTITSKDHDQVSSDKECFALVKSLNQDTTYFFRVCGVNSNGNKGPYSDELKLVTKIHPAGRVAITISCVGACFLLAPAITVPLSVEILSFFIVRYGMDYDKYRGLQEPPESDDEQ